MHELIFVSSQKKAFSEVLFSVKNHTKYRYRRRIKKSQWNQKLAIDNVINNDNNVVNIDNIGNSMNRHMQQIDQQTGEVIEGFVAYVVPKRKTDFRKDGWQWLKKQ